MEYKVSNLTPYHFLEVKLFTDEFIGKDYYSINQLYDIYNKSCLKGHNCSYVIFKDGKIKGIRLSYMPTKWDSVKGQDGLSPELWTKLEIQELGYFQSLFFHPEIMGQGWAPVLSNLSIIQMKKAGAKGVLTHSWLESPKNSSRIYLEKIGFNLIKEHPLYWNKVDYICTRCGKPCMCTAGEMIKKWETL